MSKQTKSSGTAGENIEIRGRKMDFDFDFSQQKKYWNNDCAFSTTYNNALSCHFPEGERFFMDSVRYYKDLITDPVLKQQIKGFIHQEAMHGHEHEAFNQFIEDCGYPAKSVERHLKTEMKWMRKLLPKSFQLGITCALEHFTAIMAHQMLNDKSFSEGMDPKLKELWMWHAVEETEHKAVAFDVFQACVGSYWIRIFTMILVTLGFQLRTSVVQASFLWADKKLFSPKVWLDGLKFYFVSPGLFRKMGKDYLDYFRPGFHPWQHNNQHFIDEWKAENTNYKTI